VTLNYDLFKSKKENGKYHKDNNKRKEQNWQQPKIEVLEINLSEWGVVF
jgi:hypothetical protein